MAEDAGDDAEQEEEEEEEEEQDDDGVAAEADGSPTEGTGGLRLGFAGVAWKISL